MQIFGSEVSQLEVYMFVILHVMKDRNPRVVP